MKLSKEERPGAIVINIEGTLDASNVHEFNDFIQQLAPYSKNIGMNMEKLSFIDSTGIGALVNLLSRLRQVGKSLYLFSLPPQVKEVFDTVKVSSFMNITSKTDFDMMFPDQITSKIRKLL